MTVTDKLGVAPSAQRRATFEARLLLSVSEDPKPLLLTKGEGEGTSSITFQHCNNISWAPTVDLDKAPYFVTLALALFGWSANHVVNRITDAPTLEFQVGEPVQDANNALWTQRITLTNLTRKQTFENLSVMLVARKGSTLASDHLQLRPVAPAFEGDESWESEGGRATFTVPKLHPGSSVQVLSAYTGGNPPVFRIKSQGTVFATRANWETWFVRNEVLILIPLAILWAAVIAIYAYSNLFAYRKSSGEPTKRHAPFRKRKES